MHAEGERPPRSPSSPLRARKVRPGYAEGPLVRAAWARNQAEAEIIQGLLLEEGIPSLARRSGGFDVPDFLAAGPRDILVAVLRRWTPRARCSATAARGAGCRRSAIRAWVRALAVTLALIVFVTVRGRVRRRAVLRLSSLAIRQPLQV